MKLTRKMEERLIKIALNKLMELAEINIEMRNGTSKKSKGFTGKKWTPEQRKKFLETMKKKKR